MLDNIADLLLTVSLLAGVFAFPAAFALRYMVPGTAIGVLVGDLLFFWLAFRLASRTGRNDHHRHAFRARYAQYLWHGVLCARPSFSSRPKSRTDAGRGGDFIPGILASVPFSSVACSNWHVPLVPAGYGLFLPRAGLLGSLAAVALVLISFLPLLEILHLPVVGIRGTSDCIDDTRRPRGAALQISGRTGRAA